MPVSTQKRKMTLDASNGCKKCGILMDSLTVSRRGERELCRACKCAETAAMSFQTPCGQRYCKRCGILIEPFVLEVYEPQHCSACTLLLSAFITLGDFSKAAGRCKCEFCSSRWLSPPDPKTAKLTEDTTSMRPSRVMPSQGGVSGITSDSESGALKERESQVEEELRNKWEREQLALKKELVTRDSSAVKKILQAISTKDTRRTFYIGGVDISFIKGNNVDACAALIIISFPELKMVYKRLEIIQLTAPYIPGFLAFREVDSLIHLYKAMLKNAPQYKPDVILVDGNGQLHPRGFGLACHLGVKLGVPCVGVAKTLIYVDGIEDNAGHKAKKQSLKKAGDTFSLTTDGGEMLGKALRSTDSATNPVYVSVGHKISLQSAVTLVQHCTKYRIPEPTRFADLYSRQYLANENREPEELIILAGESPVGWP